MRKVLLPLIMIAGFLAVDTTAYASDDDNEFRARLRGDNEVPLVITDTRGRVKLKFKDDLTAVRFRVKVRDGIRVTQAHLHCAPAGANGPIVAFLAGFHDLGWNVDGNWIRDVKLTDDNILVGATPSTTCPDTIETIADLFDAILAGNVYANVHTVANPAGEVRGQVEED